MAKLIMAPWELDFQTLCARQFEPSASKFSTSQVACWRKFLVQSGAKEDVVLDVDKIATKNTPVIISGQQIGIGISPLLSLFKILSIENLAKSLETKIGKEIKPIFWMQTEDHDIDEVLQLGLFESDFSYLQENIQTLTSRIDNDHSSLINFRKSVGSVSNDEILPELFEGLFSKFGNLEILQKLQLAYNGATLSAGFARFFYSMFPDSNVLLFDIRVEGLEGLKVDVFGKALNDSIKIEEILTAQESSMLKNGEHVQVKIKPNSPLLFFHPEGPDGKRFRLRSHNFDYEIPELSFRINSKELYNKLLTSPESFSSSALLRPLLQDYLFNTIAYVGGPAELNYLRQIEPLYQEFSVIMPLRILRPSGLVLSDKAAKHFEDVPPRMFFDEEKVLKDGLIKLFIPENFRPDNVFNGIKQEQLAVISEKLSNLQTIDSTLEKPRMKTLSVIVDALEKFFEKYEVALIKNEGVINRRLENLVKQTHPNGIFQERVISCLALGMLYGVEFFEDVSKQFKVWFNRNVLKENL